MYLNMFGIGLVVLSSSETIADLLVGQGSYHVPRLSGQG